MTSLPLSDKPLAFSYIRMSTAIQLKGDSLRRQKELSAKYADENGLHLVEGFSLEDIGVSAFRGKHAKAGALGRFLDAIEADEIPKGSYLLVESLDRLSRQAIMPALQQFLGILNAGITVVTLSDNQVYRGALTDFSQLIISITVMSRAFEESNMKSQRLSAVWSKKRSEVHKVKLTGRCPAWLSLNSSKTEYLIIEDKANSVRQIFDLAINGMGSYGITRYLNKIGVPSLGQNEKWVKSYVTKILTNRAVYGEYQPHRRNGTKRVPEGSAIPNYFPKVVSEDVFWRVQAGRSHRAKNARGRKGSGLSNLFTNLAKCSYCGAAMHFVNKGAGPKGGYYLRCDNSISGKGCMPNTWRYSDFETSFLYFCRELDLRELVMASSDRNSKARKRELILETERKLSSLELQRQRTYDLLIDRPESAEFLSDQLSKLGVQIKEAKARLTDIQADIDHAGTPEQLDTETLLDVMSIFQNASAESGLEFRLLLRSRILSFVETLVIASAGSRPHNERTYAKILRYGGEIDELEAAEKYVAISREYMNGGDSIHYFFIRFIDGTERYVFVDPSSPTELHSMLELKDGTPPWFSSGWKIQPPSIDDFLDFIS